MSFGYRLNPNTVNMMVKKFDRIGQGNVAFDDFIQLCVNLHVSTLLLRSPHSPVVASNIATLAEKWNGKQMSVQHVVP